jgi:hypothetical protein
VVQKINILKTIKVMYFGGEDLVFIKCCFLVINRLLKHDYIE